MPWQQAEPGTLAQDSNGVFHIKAGGQWVAAPKGSVAQDAQGAYHFNSDSMQPPPVVPAKSAQQQQQPESGGEGSTGAPAEGAAAQGAGGLSDILSTVLTNLPHSVAHAAQTIFHGGTEGTDQGPAQLGPEGQQLVQHISAALAPILSALPSHQGAPQDIPGLGPTANDLARRGANVMQAGMTLAPAATPLLKGVGMLSDAADAAAAAKAAIKPPPLGMVTGDSAAARTLAGPSALPAVAAKNQGIANTQLASSVGAPLDRPLGVKNADGLRPLDQAKDAPNAVYQRLGNSVPAGQLTPDAAQAVDNVGANDMVVHSPDIQRMIDAQKQRLLTANNTGSQWIDAERSLRYNGFKNSGLDDPENQALGKAQLGMSDAVHNHIAATLPADAPVSIQQYEDARRTLAQINTLQDNLSGDHIDMQGLARFDERHPNILSGPMADVAEFARRRPDVTSLPSKGEMFDPSGFAKDVGAIDLKKPTSYLQPLTGTLARGRLTAGPTVPPTGLGADFAPIVRPPTAPEAPGAAIPQGALPTPGGSPANRVPIPKQGGAVSFGRNVNQLGNLEVPGNGNELSPASLEAANRPASNVVHWDGDRASQVLGDVTNVDHITPPKGSIAVDATTGKLVSSGTTPRNLVEGLLARWRANPPLGQAF